MAPRGRFQARSSDGKTPKGAPFLPAPRLRTLRQSIRAARARPQVSMYKAKTEPSAPFLLVKEIVRTKPRAKRFRPPFGKDGKGAGIPRRLSRRTKGLRQKGAGGAYSPPPGITVPCGSRRLRIPRFARMFSDSPKRSRRLRFSFLKPVIFLKSVRKNTACRSRPQKARQRQLGRHTLQRKNGLCSAQRKLQDSIKDGVPLGDICSKGLRPPGRICKSRKSRIFLLTKLNFYHILITVIL